jgi:ankyrin repeat protein
MSEVEQTLKQAFCEDNPSLLREALARYPEAKKRINDPLGPFDSPLINSVRSREMLDAMLEAGADINAKSQWWAGGFCLLDSAADDLAGYAIQRGAVVGIHAAARLGLTDRLRELVAKDCQAVHARGGDGKTPLHFARTVEVAKFLLEHGADINARDIDHESTAAQHLIEERPDVVRFLVSQGAETDIFIASALGDLELAKEHLRRDPQCIRLRVDAENFPMANPRAGGTIYNWTLGWYVSPHQVARKFGHDSLLRWLMEQSPPEVKLVNACWLGDAQQVDALLSQNPTLAKSLSQSESRQLVHAARNNELAAVREMLRAGLPVDCRGQLGGTPLHWAAWHGNVEMVKALLAHEAPLEILDVDNQAPPLGWAIHGSENGWHRDSGDYGATVEALLKAGAKIPPKFEGSAAVKNVLASWASNRA